MTDDTRDTPRHHTRSVAWSVASLVAAGVLWSFGGVLIKLIHDEGRGPHGVTIAFYRSMFAGLFLLPFARRRMSTLWTHKSKPGQAATPTTWRSLRPEALLCVLFFSLMTVCFVIANTQTQAANAIILQYTSTFWIFALSPLILGERASAADMAILGVAVVGIAIIFFGNAGSGILGLANALGAGLFYGLLTMMIRRLRDCDPAAVAVINLLGSALLIAPFMFLVGGGHWSMSTYALLGVIGIVQFGVPYYLFSMGLRRVPAYQAGLITLIEPVLVPVWTFLALGETVPRSTALGGGIIMLALVMFILAARRRASALRAP